MVGLISEVQETNSLPNNAVDIVAEFSAYGNDAYACITYCIYSSSI